MPYGYHGKILRVDLTDRSIEIEERDALFYRRYFGGWNLIAYYLLRELPAGADPLGEENLLIFAPGVVTGAPVPGAGRHAVGAKSPLTGAFGEGDVGGFWGAELKRAGFDAVVVKGKAEKPVYLWIHDGEAEVRDAGHLWGKETLAVQGQLRRELGDKGIRVAQIGPAGEKLVRLACVLNDVSRAAGRPGLGAVMGAKRLKAIAVRGSAPGPELAERERVRSVARWMAQNYREHPRSGSLSRLGTAGVLMGLNFAGGLPTLNFGLGDFEGAEALSGETVDDSILIRRETCHACVVRCKPVVEVKGRYSVDPAYGGPEYETLSALGSNCGVDALEALAYANQRCAALGLDTIGVGNCIAFAMECYRDGLIGQAETGGLELTFGNAEAMVEMVEQIGGRQGFGEIFAEGLLPAVERLGPKARKFAMEVKGLPLPMHEPRLKQGLGIGYAVSPTGADHCHNIHDTLFSVESWAWKNLDALGVLETVPNASLDTTKVKLLLHETHLRLFQNSACLCFFLPYTYAQLADIVQGVTGWETSAWEILKLGERAMNLARAFNFREGLIAQDDYLPDRFFQPFPSGPLKGVGVDKEAFRRALATYYRMAGWDPETGAPTALKLAELDIGWVAEEMRKR